MTASAFVVRLDDQAPHSALINGANTMVVWADSSTMAKEVAASYYDGDANAQWTDATTVATPVVAPTALTWADLSLNVAVLTPGDIPIVNTVVAGGATVDAMAALMVTALNATVINGASYNTGTNVLTVAAIADGIGDHKIIHKWFRTTDTGAKAIASLAGAEVEEGIAAAALTITLPADNATLPGSGWSDFAVNVLVAHPTTHAIVANVTVEGGVAAVTIDDFGNALVTALNATAIDGASYDESSNILTVAETTDVLGDHIVTAKVYRLADATQSAIPTLIGAITDAGTDSDALTIQLATSALTVPSVVLSGRA